MGGLRGGEGGGLVLLPTAAPLSLIAAVRPAAAAAGRAKLQFSPMCDGKYGTEGNSTPVGVIPGRRKGVLLQQKNA